MAATCIHGDCLEVMKTLPEKSVDLFLCDLPYGCLTASGSGVAKTRKGGSAYSNTGCSWDVKIDLEKFWIEVKRLCKNDKTPVIMFCNTRFGVDLINSNPSWFRYDLVWNKLSGTNFLHANKQPMTSHEMIYVFSKKGAFYKRINQAVNGKEAYSEKVRYREGRCYAGAITLPALNVDDNKRCSLSIVNINRVQDKRHPTCKPLDLYKWLVERYSNEGDCVLDATAGSFNSGHASIELGRNYIGIEKDEKFYEHNKI